MLLAASVLQDVLLLVFAACLVASVLRGAALWLHVRTGVAAGWCLSATILLIVVLFATGVCWTGHG